VRIFFSWYHAHKIRDYRRQQITCLQTGFPVGTTHW